MYLFLFAFGAVLGLAGIILAASGLSVHDRTFDASLVTPGIVAVVGGLLLIGLGFALRILQRIERALEMRPALPRTADIGATHEPAAGADTEPPSDISRIPFPARVTRPAQGSAAVDAAPHTDKRTDEPPLKFPKVVRAASAPKPEETDTPPRLPLPAASDDEAAIEDSAPSFSRPFRSRNGAAPATRTSPRLDTAARAPLATQRPAPAFKALWKGPRRSTAQARPAPELPGSARQPLVQQPDLRGPAVQQSIPQESADEPALQQRAAPSSAVAPYVAPEQAAEPLTVLKSGIVDGMAYTLYSDGSIEAQLPQGLLRFGSISELRAHIEQDTPSP